MPALTRKRVNDRPETWHVHYAGVRVGVIVERSGAQPSSDLWQNREQQKSRHRVENGDGFSENEGSITSARNFNDALLQRVVDRGELVVQVAAEAVDHSDDRERNAGCDQTVFDGGGGGFIVQEVSKKFGHYVTPVRVRAAPPYQERRGFI